MILETTTVNYEGLDYEMTGYYSAAERGSFNYWDGGCPDSSASFEVRHIYINGVDVIDKLNEKTIYELVDLAIINLK